MLTRKHFKAIAEAISQTRVETYELDLDADSRVALGILTEKLALVCRAENPNFDWGRFIEAAQ